MVDNSNFPRVAPGENMAVAIRAMAKSKCSLLTGANRIPVRSPQVSYAHVIDTCELDSDGYDTEIDLVGASPAVWQHVFSAIRNQANKTSTRFNPINKEKCVHWNKDQKEARPNPRPVPYVELPPPPRRAKKPLEPKGDVYNHPHLAPPMHRVVEVLYHSFFLLDYCYIMTKTPAISHIFTL